jgi:hypothetical protein
MTLVREVADAVKMIADVVRSTRELVDAVNGGRAYLASRHPEAGEDFAALLGQMQRAMEGLAEVTKVVSGFRFEIEDGKAVRGEVARFNAYVVEQGKAVTSLRAEIKELKADCDKVRDLRDALDAHAAKPRFGSMFGLLGVESRKRAEELAARLSNFYADDQRMIDALSTLLELADRALGEADEALGPRATAYADNVDEAATILRMYAVAFDDSRRQLDAMVDSLDATARALTKPPRRRR